MKRSVIALTVALVLGVTALALAHAVVLWAYVEDGRLYVEAFFSSGKKVKNAEVVVLDAEGKQLLSGKTNDQGLVDFPAPPRQALTIKLELSHGHQAEFKIKPEDYDPPPELSPTPAETPASTSSSGT